jgi:hypothetical protein
MALLDGDPITELALPRLVGHRIERQLARGVGDVAHHHDGLVDRDALAGLRQLQAQFFNPLLRGLRFHLLTFGGLRQRAV